MSIVHIPFYPSDWLAGTRGLSDAETGVYITLIARIYEMAGPIERDDERLYRLCGSKSKSAFVKSLEYLIAEGKIIQTESGLSNERAQKVIKETTEKSSKAKDAAQSRWDRKPNKNKGGDDANASAKHMPQRCQSYSASYEKREANASPKKGARLSVDWTLPKDWGEWAVSEGWPEPSVRSEAVKFRDFWIGKAGKDAAKLDWQATWRNWMRNSRTPKIAAITGGQNDKPTSKSQRRMDAFIAGARGSTGTP